MATSDHRTRLDVALVERGLVPTRARARDAIVRGGVTVDGTIATRPAVGVSPEAEIAVDDAAARYVSRGALKLAAAPRCVRVLPGRAGGAGHRRLDRRIHAGAAGARRRRGSTRSTSATASSTRGWPPIRG